MVEIKRTGDLETSEDLAFERTSMRVRCVGRAFLILFVLLAAAGLFGDGPLSHARAGDESGFFVRYERFARVDGTTRFEIHPHPQNAAAPRRFFTSTSLFERGHVEHYVPEPSSVEIAADRAVITFPRVEAGGLVVLLLRPSRPGLLRFSLGEEGGPALDLSLLVYP
ncbi:hypothetical protein KEG38_16365 [Polyangium jinanense]|uniref:hypothetical protein n=1 Tax=Polyangium jinanense TaxID=2829994 RepID=UPI0023408F16|nr:hypothetical protein [Polyangium jinanense]MDC3955443.1 hypothetical protein [Polyangium jinanense]